MRIIFKYSTMILKKKKKNENPTNSVSKKREDSPKTNKHSENLSVCVASLQ